MRYLTTLIAGIAVGLLAVAEVRAAVLTIDQSSEEFSEKLVTVKPGDTVSFVNRDNVTYNISVIDDDDNATDLGLQKPGQVLNFRFDETGRFKVRCSIHPDLKMSVTVM